ncbi:DeoR/GlpR family DNA-binding transcription regulator [Rhizobium sp. PL01]|uniref:DeoR/GlpR family DNA-binding transcription regulator n=1 Tax=Rhizobium sp. PL01 TaxID=3085631 RepID=UPI0029818F92|nr:DeoR/GlpR family DNA-binding transcription regulator [Rhizobium sp. PL01]MDW5315617.1 DeoR/GlpR family DNA-binding transcription regulator [Rhizobium sp. PL01]
MIGFSVQTELLLKQRQSLIQDRLRLSGRVLAIDLAQEFNVSEDTIRRDLRELAAAGLCERVYGGALPVSPGGTTLTQRVGLATERKAALAASAVGVIKSGMTVFFDASSTNLAIAQALPAGIELTAATNTPLIAAALMEKPGINIILIGGKIDRLVGAAIGAKAQRDVEALRPDLCILGACGVDINAGLTVFEYEDAEFKRLVARNSAAVLAAVTNDKLGTSAPHAVITTRECTTLIVEHDAPADTADIYSTAGVAVVHAGETRP